MLHPPVDDGDDRARCDHDELRAPLTHMKRNKAIVTESQLMLAAPRDMTEQPLVIGFPDGTTQGEWP